MAQPRQAQAVALLLGGLVAGGLGGVAALGAPEGEEPVQVLRTAATPSARPTPQSPPPGSLAAYALDADRVCARAFASVKPVDLLRQSLAQVLADRVTSAALEVRTAQQLLALERPADPRTARVAAVLTAHRSAYAAVGAAARDDGRALPQRSQAVVRAEPRTRASSVAAGRVFLALGSQRCGAWLNPAALQDSVAD